MIVSINVMTDYFLIMHIIAYVLLYILVLRKKIKEGAITGALSLFLKVLF